MDAEERAIYYYLKSRRPAAISARDINRHVGSKRKFKYSPDWANSALLRMMERGILETDAQNAYRLKPMPRKDPQGKSWTSPEIAKILTASGKVFNNLLTVEDEDEYYDRL